MKRDGGQAQNHEASRQPYTSMNTMVYADVTEALAGSASTIASAMQQVSISFGVATASLATAFFVRNRFHTSAPEMIHGIHQAFLVLGGLTFLSSVVFMPLCSSIGTFLSNRLANCFVAT